MTKIWHPYLSVMGILVLAFTLLLISAATQVLAASQQKTAVAAPAAPLDLSLELVTGGLSLPTSITHTPLPADGRLFVTQQGGQILIIDPSGVLLPDNFLNISSKVRLYGESGLLGLAFDPNYAANGYFYVYYTDKISYNNHLSRFQVFPGSPNLADPASEVILMTIFEPKEGHNGGALAFGPDGYLYIGVGDGGLEPQSNPTTRPQDLTSLLGKILRIDVSQAAPTAPECGSAYYTIPANPLADGPGGACDEIWAYGLRNPWRISFDALTGDLFIADVGEQRWEEINQQPFGSGGQNYGWPCYEGDAIYHAGSCTLPPQNYTFPIFTYSHDTPENHCSVTGGYLYRGSQYPAMWGHYLLADFCSGHLWSVKQSAASWTAENYGDLTNLPTTFGEDFQGELYIAELTSGNIYHITENTALPTLNITKSGPQTSEPGAPIQYQITVSNSGAAAATQLVITDTLPAGAAYVSSDNGSALLGEVVSWQVDSLGSSSTLTVSFTVTATETITNADYGVLADANVYAQGETAVVTHRAVL